jgi:hypothetical protein
MIHDLFVFVIFKIRKIQYRRMLLNMEYHVKYYLTFIVLSSIIDNRTETVYIMTLLFVKIDPWLPGQSIARARF